MITESVYVFLERNSIDCNPTNIDLYKEFSLTAVNEEEVVLKIREYNDYIINHKKKFPESMMHYLRMCHGYGRFDFSYDKELCELSIEEAFTRIAKWKELPEEHMKVIMEWLKDMKVKH